MVTIIIEYYLSEGKGYKGVLKGYLLVECISV